MSLMSAEERAKHARKWSVSVNVPWDKLPMEDARQAYDILQKHYFAAATILNARADDHGAQFTCYICNTPHERPARYKNCAYKKPGDTLLTVVECCGEKCARVFEERLITERRARNIEEREAHGS